MNSENFQTYLELIIVSRSIESSPLVKTSDKKEEVIEHLRKKELIGVVMILESISPTAELKALREIRNAIVHNNSNLAENRNIHSFEIVKDYLNKLESGEIKDTKDEPLEAYFSIEGEFVVLNKLNIYECLRQILMKYKG